MLCSGNHVSGDVLYASSRLLEPRSTVAAVRTAASRLGLIPDPAYTIRCWSEPTGWTPHSSFCQGNSECGICQTLVISTHSFKPVGQCRTSPVVRKNNQSPSTAIVYRTTMVGCRGEPRREGLCLDRVDIKEQEKSSVPIHSLISRGQ